MATELENCKRDRANLRRIFTRKVNEIQKLLESENPDVDLIAACVEVLTPRVQTLFDLDDRIYENLVKNSAEDERAIDEETDGADSYRVKWITIKRKIDRLTFRDFDADTVCSHQKNPSQAEYRSVSSCNSSHEGSSHRRNFKLPKLEIKKFDGNVRNWIGFWGQFRKIHEDTTIDDYDKFQYLIQSMEDDTSARNLVESFPPAAENYGKAVMQLKERFARDNLLIDVYVRDLLSLVLSQAKKNEHLSLMTLYDKLTTQLRALETLGVTSDKYAAMLLPLVESALPDETLKAYERYRMTDPTTMQDTGKMLTHLLNFVQKEVESNERISIAKTSFNSDSIAIHNEPTASCLLAGENKILNRLCIWCDKPNHSSAECSKLNKISYEDKISLIKKKKGCAICLRIGHHAKVCKLFVKCLVCSKRHHTVMCPTLSSTEKKEEKKRDSDTPNTSTAMSSFQVNTVTILQTLVVNIVQGNKKVPVRALIDSGAQRSYIQEELALKLKLKPMGEQSLVHQVFGGIERKMRKHKVYEVCLENLDGSFRLNMITLDEPKICGSLPSASRDLTQRLKELNISVTDNGDIKDIGILIGADFASYLITSTFVEIDQGLVAMKTKLGWTVQGKGSGIHSSSENTNLNVISVLFSKTDINITDLWDLETIGIHDKPLKITEEEILENFKGNLRVNEEGRYEVALPWKHDQNVLSTNRDLIEKRLLSTTKRLNTIDKFTDYDKVFKEWLQLGIIEEVNPDSRHGHYLAHHAVIRESSLTTKIRPVFDASAKGNNQYSLNSCLKKGVNLIELIPMLLTRFRMHAVGISSDIAKAFLQISLREKDREYLKFLWWKNHEQNEIITYQHCRVVFGLTCSPFLLAGTIKYHLENYQGPMQDTARQLLECFYTDNCVTSLEQNEVSKFVSEAREIMSLGKFDLRSWIIAPLRETEPERNLVSVLGVQWDTVNDMLSCNTENLMTMKTEKVTKRSLLSLAHRLFDPIGFTAPISLIPKIILQRAWLENRGWDEELSESMAKEYRSWLSELHILKECKIPRRLTSAPIRDCHRSLHVFCDASIAAYATCIFLRTEFEDKVDVNLVLAKARVAPSKQQVTIPRLELLAALIGTRLCSLAQRSLNLDCELYYWTDSSVVLTWIQKDAQWDRFVKNRVHEIRRSSNSSDWRHIPGSLNPADLLSKGCNAIKLIQSAWWNGPSWLKENKESWPNTSIIHLVNMSDCVNIVDTKTKTTEVKFTDVFSKFSKYSQIIRILAYIIRFCANCRSKVNKIVNQHINFHEYSRAEMTMYKIIQQETYNEKLLPDKNLQCFTDENDILRVNTKLLLRDDELDFKRPILLPARHFVVSLLVREYHIRLLHAGVQIVIANLRRRVWICGVRRLARKLINSCVTCKRYTAKPADSPSVPLPLRRIDENAAVFQTTGIDLAGPLYLKSGQKAYIVLFTCAVFRAIHLELVESLSTESFLLALRRFIARRGRMHTIYTDNGSNFIGANNLFKKLDWHKIEQETAARQIHWIFNPPTAAWWGGWWERLIRLVKDLLKRVLGKAKLNYIELFTMLCDVESVLNSRPLTYIGDSDLLMPLTPATYMQDLPSSEVSDLDTIEAEGLVTRGRYLAKLRKDLKGRFLKEYLATLVHRGRRAARSLSIGDVVLMEAGPKRNTWPFGRIIKLIPGVDGWPRVAQVKCANGIFTRPIQRLYSLEL